MNNAMLRCEHCGKKYVYCNQGHDVGSSQKYCGDCQRAIDNALSQIPKRIVSRTENIYDEEEKNRINDIFDKEVLMIEFKDDPDNCLCTFIFTPVVPNWGYKSVESCYIDRVKYYRCINNDDTFDIKANMEYDLIDKKLTGDLYHEPNVDFGVTQYKRCRQSTMFDNIDTSVKPKPMKLPVGNLEYLNCKI